MSKGPLELLDDILRIMREYKGVYTVTVSTIDDLGDVQTLTVDRSILELLTGRDILPSDRAKKPEAGDGEATPQG